MDVFEKRSSDLSWQGPPGFLNVQFLTTTVIYLQDMKIEKLQTLRTKKNHFCRSKMRIKVFSFFLFLFMINKQENLQGSEDASISENVQQ
jgi:hypothetical protein